MSVIATRLGAACYVLWGVVHVLGGIVMLLTLEHDGGAAVFRMLATAAPTAVPDAFPGVATAVLGFHAWNMVWIGGLVTVVAIGLNWRNRRLGFWLNLVLAGAADLGLVAALLLPGHMRLTDGLPGLVLFLPAAGLTAWGLRAPPPPPAPA